MPHRSQSGAHTRPDSLSLHSHDGGFQFFFQALDLGLSLQNASIRWGLHCDVEKYNGAGNNSPLFIVKCLNLYCFEQNCTCAGCLTEGCENSMTKFHLIKAAVLVAVVAVLLVSVCRQVKIIFTPVCNFSLSDTGCRMVMQLFLRYTNVKPDKWARKNFTFFGNCIVLIC